MVNHLNVAVDLYCASSEYATISGTVPGSTPFTKIETVQPNAHFDVPLFVAYHCKLYVKPLGVGYVDLVICINRLNYIDDFAHYMVMCVNRCLRF